MKFRLFKKKGWEKLDDTLVDQVRPKLHGQELESGMVYLEPRPLTHSYDDLIDPHTIKITVNCEAYTIHFMWGRDELRIPGISESYLQRFTQITKHAIDNKLLIRFECEHLKKTDPLSVSKTFVTVK